MELNLNFAQLVRSPTGYWLLVDPLEIRLKSARCSYMVHETLVIFLPLSALKTSSLKTCPHPRHLVKVEEPAESGLSCARSRIHRTGDPSKPSQGTTSIGENSRVTNIKQLPCLEWRNAQLDLARHTELHLSWPGWQALEFKPLTVKQALGGQTPIVWQLGGLTTHRPRSATQWLLLWASCRKPG